MENHPTSSKERLSALAAFLPRFERPGSFGEWRRPTTVEPGVMVMPYYDYSTTANTFVEMVYESGWIVGDLDWPTWQNSAEATELRNNLDKLAQASLSNSRDFSPCWFVRTALSRGRLPGFTSRVCLPEL